MASGPFTSGKARSGRHDLNARMLNVVLDRKGGDQEDPLRSVNIRRIVANIDRKIRDRVLKNYGLYVVNRAKANIREGTKARGGKAKTGSKGDLARSIKILSTRGDTVTITYGEGLPYAFVHDLPNGSTYEYQAKNVKYLVFPNRRAKGKPLTRTIVSNRPTQGYMSEAVDDADDKADQFLQDAIEQMAPAFDQTAYVISGEGGKIQRFGSLGIKGAKERGLVRSSRERRDARLTAKGKRYVASRSR